MAHYVKKKTLSLPSSATLPASPPSKKPQLDSFGKIMWSEVFGIACEVANRTIKEENSKGYIHIVKE
ncbi:hypothetical protein MRB53_008910 [Persea americana]|uniref:Uncharacterized protein n=1 Tax=Persea americana TaxID=3435 RepID=A0ACC2LML8_PERAE|nr:hypothetical protein MRB53_008910 [Persea americana]